MIEIKHRANTVHFRDLSKELQPKVSAILNKHRLLQQEDLDDFRVSIVSCPPLEITLLKEIDDFDADDGDYTKKTFLPEESVNLEHVYHYPREKCFLVKQLNKEEMAYAFFLYESRDWDTLYIYEMGVS